MKYYLRGLLYNKEVAALQKSFSSCPTSVPWDVEIRPCTSGNSARKSQLALVRPSHVDLRKPQMDFSRD